MNTVKFLEYYNHWRKGGGGSQPSPKRITKAIKNAIKEIAQKDEYRKLYHTALCEFRAYLLFTEHLYNTIDEIETVTSDPLVKEICKNVKERHNLDKLIHNRKIFE
jgi:hypothetical protein